MKVCPFTAAADHPVTWRCYAVLTLDWLLDRTDRYLPFACCRPWFWLLRAVERPAGRAPQEP